MLLLFDKANATGNGLDGYYQTKLKYFTIIVADSKTSSKFKYATWLQFLIMGIVVGLAISWRPTSLTNSLGMCCQEALKMAAKRKAANPDNINCTRPVGGEEVMSLGGVLF